MKIASRLLLAITALALAAALLAGCGSGTSKSDYESQVQKIGKTVESDLDKLDSGQPSAADLAVAVKSLNKAADKLDAIEPPSEVKSLHEDLVATLNDTADLLGRMAPIMAKAAKDPTSMGQKDIDQMTEISNDFSDIEKRMAKIEKGFKAKEYETGLNTSGSSSK